MTVTLVIRLPTRNSRCGNRSRADSVSNFVMPIRTWASCLVSLTLVSMNSVNIEIWSDIACPWCWVGKRSLEAAIASSDHKVAIRWRAFELNPDAPANAPEAVDYVARLADKYGTSRDEAEGFIARMVGNSRTGMTGNSRTGIEKHRSIAKSERLRRETRSPVF